MRRLLIGGVLLLALAGCGGSDEEKGPHGGVGQSGTDVSLVCERELAFATTDSYDGGIVRVPEWDSECSNDY